MTASSFMVLIDGTGPYNGNQYERDFEFSFLHQLYKQLKDARSVYFAGPGTLGLTTRTRANKGYDALRTQRAANPRCKLFIAGYSRGGAAAMELAKMCAYGSDERLNDPRIIPERLPIEALFLLDPVSKDLYCSGGGIPNVVKTAYCMYRDKTIWEYSPKLRMRDFASPIDKSLAVGFNSTGQNDPDRYARKFMGNAPYDLAPGNTRTRLRRAVVIKGASHGAIGGLPWVERREDQQPVNEAAALLNAWLSENSLGVKVMDNSYAQANLKNYPRVPPPHENLARDLKYHEQHRKAVLQQKCLK
jgi:hypothetical protein